MVGRQRPGGAVRAVSGVLPSFQFAVHFAVALRSAAD